MELKSRFCLRVRTYQIGSNRTFMELKFVMSLVLLIIICSNRTFMELKYGVAGHNFDSINGSNRTFMELKF